MIKTLSKQIKGFVKESVLTPVFMILEVVFETLIPLLMASIIDDGINKGDMNHILFVGGGMVLCAIGGLICGILGGSFGAKASAGFARNLRRSMFANIQTFSFSNIDKYSTAGLVTRLTTDVTNFYRCNQLTKCVSDDTQNVYACTDKPYLCNGYGIYNQRKTCKCVPRCNYFSCDCSCFPYEIYYEIL